MHDITEEHVKNRLYEGMMAKMESTLKKSFEDADDDIKGPQIKAIKVVWGNLARGLADGIAKILTEDLELKVVEISITVPPGTIIVAGSAVAQSNVSPILISGKAVMGTVSGKIKYKV